MAEPLAPEVVEQRLTEIPGWSYVDGRLRRSFTFRDFVEAFGFMTRVALVAEKLDHHPDWSNSWNRVDIDVTSHQAGGVTDRCFALAASIDRLHSST